ncbi:hypothetical protein [Candidatus Methylobacter oryzae]|uniref:DUF697 domain-containing protein n=1 Tax=Candidatus Methylobacter oryzae TaxID=2497749 RepID=A0ABY3C5R3_9GAMM|nr:hypothetical protein [Candidatus Methylobacter oryzae]TRW90018.1 hypothetical protein EKO24_020580 [Candidatus Methylobacter oryzae]
MADEQRRAKAKKIINDVANTAATTTAVFSQIPGMGVATLTKLYVDMAKKIAVLFNRELESGAARMLVLEGCKHHAGAIFKKSVLGWVPFLGNMINAKITFDLTKKVGWFFYDYFNSTSE